MLTLYRRHQSDCKHKTKGRQFRRCKCPIWIQGTVEGNPLRKALDVASWERAEEIKGTIEHGTRETNAGVTIEDALNSFVSDCEQRKLSPSTLGKYRLLRAHMALHFGSVGLSDVRQCTAEHIRAFRAGRGLGARTSAKELERVRAFFNYCVDNDWIEKSPARKIKAPEADLKAVEPFSRDEQSRIMETAYRLAETQESPSEKSLPVNPKTGTFARLLLHSGLRITNAATLTKDDIRGDKIIKVTQKRRKLVAIRLPPDLLAEIRRIPTHDLFRSPDGSQRPETVSDYWRDQLAKVFRYAGIKGAHPHRFRHSLAVNMLSVGSSVEDVAAVLGNSPAIVAEHYSAWVSARQERLDGQLEKAWAKPMLKLVK